MGSGNISVKRTVMNSSDTALTGGAHLVRQLLRHGVKHVFCVPGESYLGVLDALYEATDKISLVTTRIEIGACHMAEAYGKITGRPGICFVSRGPGVTHAMIGCHTARQDSTPLILFVGMVARPVDGREAVQEIDLRAMFSGLAKDVMIINDPKRIPELVSRAFHVAAAGRPGPVVVGLPEDMCDEECVTNDVAPYKTVRAAPASRQMDQLHNLLRGAKRPLLMIGGGGWSADGVRNIQRFAENYNLPVVTTFRCQDLFNNFHSNFAGQSSLGMDKKVADLIADADVLIAVATRLGEFSTDNYTLIQSPCPTQTLVHVHPDPEELGRVYQGELLINAGPDEFAEMAAVLQPPSEMKWGPWTQDAHRNYEATLVPDPTPGAVNLAQVMQDIQNRMTPDTFIACDGGNFATWLNRYIRFSRFRSFIGPTCGAMGYGVPSAIAAKLLLPEREVICFVGDGGFMMTGLELATAVQYDAPLVYLVFNNNLYGTIRMHQEREHPGRPVATDLINPDFAAFARSFGAFGAVVRESAAFGPTYDEARSCGKPAVIELKVDPEAITTRATLTDIREAAKARHRS